MTLHDRDDLFAKNRALAIFLARAFARDAGSKNVEDLEQEASLALWDATRQYDQSRHPGVPFANFAARAIRSALTNALDVDRRQGLVHAPEGVRRENVDVDSLSEGSLRNDLAGVLWGAINGLGPVEQRVLVLRTGLNGDEPKSLLECAAECGVSFATAKRIVAKARDTIRSELQRQGMDPEKWMTIFPRKANISVS
jgi:RNA polymerase sigma factor (sigma-70 family)